MRRPQRLIVNSGLSPTARRRRSEDDEAKRSWALEAAAELGYYVANQHEQQEYGRREDGYDQAQSLEPIQRECSLAASLDPHSSPFPQSHRALVDVLLGDMALDFAKCLVANASDANGFPG